MFLVQEMVYCPDLHDFAIHTENVSNGCSFLHPTNSTSSSACYFREILFHTDFMICSVMTAPSNILKLRIYCRRLTPLARQPMPQHFYYRIIFYHEFDDICTKTDQFIKIWPNGIRFHVWKKCLKIFVKISFLIWKLL